jgi:FdhD protein
MPFVSAAFNPRIHDSDRTGGLHAAGLFSREGELIAVREDVGRHNAVDKIVGWALLEDRLPLSQYVLMVSGRGGFEIIQKALVAGIPLVASVSAPSSLAVSLARELGQSLVGFLRGRRFLIYSGPERLAPAGSSHPASAPSFREPSGRLDVIRPISIGPSG